MNAVASKQFTSQTTVKRSENPDHPGVPGSDNPDQDISAAVPDFVDISHHQKDPDWAKYKAAGKKFGIVKATESNSWADSATQANRAALKSLDMPCGLYHFAGASLAHTIKPALQEADWFVSQISPMGEKEFPVLDFELAYGMTSAQQVDWISKFCGRVEEKTGKTPWAYIPTYLLKNMDASTITKYPLWLANYNSSDRDNPPSSGSWPKLTAWQYSEKATIPGMPGKVDANFLYDPSAVPGLVPPAPPTPPTQTPPTTP